MTQCAWTLFYHKATPQEAVTIFKLGDATMGFHDIPPMDLPLCDSCATIYRTDVETDPAFRFETSLPPITRVIPQRERMLD